MRISAALGRSIDSVRRTLGSVASAPSTRSWRLVRTSDDGAAWRRDETCVECLAVDAGYVVTVRRGDDGRFQLTPGHVALPSALAVASVYLEHGVPPQIDRDGRPFVGVRDGRPRQVFDVEDADRVRYVYLDVVTGIEEFPDFLAVRDDVRHVAHRMPSSRPRPASE